MTKELYRIHPDLAAQTARLYSRAFLLDPLFTYIVPDRRNRSQELSFLFEFAVNCGLKYGEVLTMGDSLQKCRHIIFPRTILI